MSSIQDGWGGVLRLRGRKRARSGQMLLLQVLPLTAGFRAASVFLSGKSLMDGTLRMTLGLNMFPTPRFDLSFPLKNDAFAIQGKCAFVNLGKKASELTVADVRGDCGWSLVQLFLQVLGVLEPAKNRMVLTKVQFHNLFTKIVKYIHFKVEEMWEAQFTEEATATRREIDNLAPKCGWKIWCFAAKFSIVYKISLIICSFAAFVI